MNDVLQQLVNGLTLGSLYALIAVGYTVVYGIVQLINFAHGEVFMIGAFGALATWSVLFEGNLALWVLPIMMLGAIIASVAVAVLMERFAYRPLRHAPRLAPLITAIGVSVFLQEAVRLFYPGAKSKLPFPAIEVVTGPALQIGGLTIQTVRHLHHRGAGHLRRTALVLRQPDQARPRDAGRRRRTPTQPGSWASTSTGSSSSRSSSARCSPPSAGVAQGLQNQNIDFRIGFLAGLKAFTAAVLGGIGNIQGAVLGGLVLGVVEAFATQFIPGQFGGSAWKDVWAFVLLIVVLVFRPQGLLGARVVDRA